MNSVDLVRKNPLTQDYEDICGKCLSKIRETELPLSLRYEDDEASTLGFAWMEALLNRDFTAFEHEFKLTSGKNKA
jgi:hypothetical protein